MPDLPVDEPSSYPNPPRSKLDRDKYLRLKAEAKAPYKILRKFIYFAFGASGFIGAVLFLAQLAAGREISSTLPNFALQVGIVILMVWLFRWEDRKKRKS